MRGSAVCVTRDGVYAAPVIYLNRTYSIPTLAVPFPPNRYSRFAGDPLGYPENLSGCCRIFSSDFQTAALSLVRFFLHRRRVLAILPY